MSFLPFQGLSDGTTLMQIQSGRTVLIITIFSDRPEMQFMHKRIMSI